MLASRTFVDITYPDDLEEDLALAERLLKARYPAISRKRYITKAGDVIWIELTVTVVSARRPTTPYVQYGMVENISERKQAEETIKRLNEDLERRVVERTAQLQATNAELEIEIAERVAVTQENVRLLEQVEQQRQRLDNIIANVPGVVWEAWGVPDAAGQRIDFVSNYVETLLGYSQEEWLETPNFWLTIRAPLLQSGASAVPRQRMIGSRHQPVRWVPGTGGGVGSPTRPVRTTGTLWHARVRWISPARAEEQCRRPMPAARVRAAGDPGGYVTWGCPSGQR